MTLVNFAIQRDRAIIAADSLIARGDHPIRDDAETLVYDTKIIPLLPRAHMVLSALGNARIRSWVQEEAMRCVRSLDQAIALLPSMLRGSFEALGIRATSRLSCLSAGPTSSSECWVCTFGHRSSRHASMTRDRKRQPM
jgi:hypothetical protein